MNQLEEIKDVIINEFKNLNTKFNLFFVTSQIKNQSGFSIISVLYKNDFIKLEITYENLCASPQKVFEQVTNFCGLQMPRKFSKTIKQKSITSANYKWKDEFTSAQKKMLTDILEDYLSRYGYI